VTFASHATADRFWRILTSRLTAVRSLPRAIARSETAAGLFRTASSTRTRCAVSTRSKSAGSSKIRRISLGSLSPRSSLRAGSSDLSKKTSTMPVPTLRVLAVFFIFLGRVPGYDNSHDHHHRRLLWGELASIHNPVRRIDASCIRSPRYRPGIAGMGWPASFSRWPMAYIRLLRASSKPGRMRMAWMAAWMPSSQRLMALSAAAMLL